MDKITKLISYIGDQIYYGPFSGLKIPDSLFKHLTVSEILGLYESCLFKVWEDQANKQVKNLMIIGGHHGYYSAALSYLLQVEDNYVFETNTYLHHLISDWSTKNNLKTPHLYESATIDIFKQWKKEIDLIVCDCEGEEIELLDPDKFPWQKECDIVVEGHPFYQENCIGTLISRFNKTHCVNIIYDDFEEDNKINKILGGFGLQKLKYDFHPTHRWITNNGRKVFTSGIFLYLTKR